MEFEPQNHRPTTLLVGRSPPGMHIPAPSTDPAEKVQGYKYPVSLLPHIPDTNNAVRTG